MTTSDITTRPFGYWITAVDRLMRAEFATVFADEGITRRHWRLLNRIDGTVPGNSGHDTHHPRRGFALRQLIELGWVERTREGWSLTEAGTLAKQRLGTAVDEIRARVSSVLEPDEYAAMTASLEKIAREFGWEEGKRLPRGHRHGHKHAEFGHCGDRDSHGRWGHRGHDEHRGHRGHRGHGHRFGGFGTRECQHAQQPATHIHLHTHS